MWTGASHPGLSTPEPHTPPAVPPTHPQCLQPRSRNARHPFCVQQPWTVGAGGRRAVTVPCGQLHTRTVPGTPAPWWVTGFDGLPGMTAGPCLHLLSESFAPILPPVPLPYGGYQQAATASVVR